MLSKSSKKTLSSTTTSPDFSNKWRVRIAKKPKGKKKAKIKWRKILMSLLGKITKQKPSLMTLSL